MKRLSFLLFLFVPLLSVAASLRIMCPGALTVTAQTNVKKPGRAAWVYWAYNHGTKDFKMTMGGFLLVIPTK